MLKKIEIKHGTMILILSNFLSLESTTQALEKLREKHKHYFDKPLSLKRMEKSMYKIFEEGYDWDNRCIYQPQATFIFSHPNQETSIYRGTESSIPRKPWVHPVECPAYILPSWVCVGAVQQSQDDIIKLFTTGSLEAKPLVKYEVLGGELPHIFFNYLEQALKPATNSYEVKPVDSYWRPEQLASMAKSKTTCSGISLVEEEIHRVKRLEYRKASISSVIVSTPSTNPRHVEPNPSDRRAWRMPRQIPEPAYQIEFVRVNPLINSFDKESVQLKEYGDETFSKPMTRTIRPLSGGDLFA